MKNIGFAAVLCLIVGLALSARSDIRIVKAENIDFTGSQPSAEAEAAIAAGDFRFLGAMYWVPADVYPEGLACIVRVYPRTLFKEVYSFNEERRSPEEMRRKQIARNFVAQYNRAIASAEAYVDTDVCSASRVPDREPRGDDGSLHVAVRLGDMDLVRERLIAGASPRDLDRWGYSSMDWATRRGTPEMVELLTSGVANGP